MGAVTEPVPEPPPAEFTEPLPVWARIEPHRDRPDHQCSGVGESLSHSAATEPYDADIEVVTWSDARDNDILAATLTRNAR